MGKVLSVLILRPLPSLVRAVILLGGERSTLPAELENGSASGPVKVFHTDPVYPRLARRRGWEGTVYLAIRIAPQGEVIATEIIESSGYEQLDQAALEAVSHWRYAWASGQPAAEGEIFTIKIRFSTGGLIPVGPIFAVRSRVRCFNGRHGSIWK